jgi:hypothetical protein
MTDLQESEIRDYLLSKKLPIDILLEVQDHFISQIKNLEFEKDLSFEDAFKIVKENWRKDLRLFWDGGFSVEDSTDFMRKIRKQIEYGNVLQTLKFVIPYIFIVFLFAVILSQSIFQIVFIAMAVIPFLFVTVNYFYHYSDFRLAKKYQSHSLTLQQDGVIIFLLVLSPVINIGSHLLDKPRNFQEIFLFKFDGDTSLTIVIVFLSLILYFGGIAYSIIAQKKYLEQIEIVKPFLKYLKPN